MDGQGSLARGAGFSPLSRAVATPPLDARLMMHFCLPSFAGAGRLSAVSLGLAIWGCLSAVPAHAQQQAAPAPEAAPPDAGAGYDPFETTNRTIFDFNNQVDKIVLVPVANAYRAVLPEPV